MIQQRTSRERGDTLIEVLIAIAVLSMAVVTSLAAMNYGQSLALTSIERTAARGELNGQLSIIRYAHDNYVGDKSSAGGELWRQILDTKVQAATPNDGDVCNQVASRPVAESNMFYIDVDDAIDAATKTDLLASLENYSYVASAPVAASDAPKPGEGIWMIARGPASDEYVDIYVKACWSPLVGAGMQQLSTVMRLYMPTGVAPELITSTPSVGHMLGSIQFARGVHL